MFALKRGLVFGIAPVLMSCGLWLDVDAPQCMFDRDCVGLFTRDHTCSNAGVCVLPREPRDAGGSDEPDLPSRWACLAEEPKTFVLDPERNVTVRMDAVEFATLRVPTDVKAAVCNPADISCESPILNDVQPGADGFFEFTVPHGFEGFMYFEAPNIVPALTYNNKPWIENSTTSGPALASHNTLMDIYERAGRPTSDDTGLAVLEIRDCNDAAADGVSFDEVDGEIPFYFDGALPTRDISATTISKLLAADRESRAVGGFSNIRAGIKTFTVRLPGTDYIVGEYTMAIRAGYISYVRIYPQWR